MSGCGLRGGSGVRGLGPLGGPSLPDGPGLRGLGDADLHSRDGLAGELERATAGQAHAHPNAGLVVDQLALDDALVVQGDPGDVGIRAASAEDAQLSTSDTLAAMEEELRNKQDEILNAETARSLAERR